MAFDLGKFFEDIFKPQSGEIVTIIHDVPHGDVADNKAWKERRQMAEDWRDQLAGMADRWGITVNPTATYAGTGSNNGPLPESCTMGGEERSLADVVNGSTIVLAMPEFSATAPLYPYAKEAEKLRVGSMPGVAKFMEESGLSADYNKISVQCKVLEEVFNRAIAADVEFSTGHTCYFDLPLENPAHIDDGILHPERAGSNDALSNLPAGEVFCVPNENEDSDTAGELPAYIGDEIAVYVVENNRIVDIRGAGPQIESLRDKFAADQGWQNIAEFAIGLNDKAKVTGIVLEDEKAGFHWAYGRSDHFGGKCGIEQFNSPENVIHLDVVYAKDSPIVCSKLDFIFQGGERQTMIVDGELQL
jgi:leucyl aminopeptidase (aminopeptidase T)